MQINQSPCFEWICFEQDLHYVSVAVVAVTSVAAVEAGADAELEGVADASFQATTVADEHAQDIVAAVAIVEETNQLAPVADAVVAEIAVATVEELLEMVAALHHFDEEVGDLLLQLEVVDLLCHHEYLKQYKI